MQILNGLATLGFVLVGSAVGVRLLALGRRTRQLPELAIGASLLVMSGLGYPLMIGAGMPGGVEPSIGVRMMAIGTLVMDLGFLGIALFTWKVFRSDARCARSLLAALAVGYAAHMVGNGAASLSLSSPSQVMQENWLWTIVGQVLNGIVFGWTAFEAYRYWWMLRKRAALGLGDPVTTNRFLLWAFAGSFSIGTNLASAWLVIHGLDFFQEAGIQATIGLCAVGACTCQYLAFLPPHRYVAHLRRA